MDIPLCRGTRQIQGTLGFLSLCFAVLCGFCGGTPLSVFAADVNVRDNPLEFHAVALDSKEVERALPSTCETETNSKEGESEEEFRFRTRLAGLLQDEPMEAMVPSLMKRDRETAVFLVSSARKESSWGEHAPQKDGVDCYNYWGYKGEGSRGTATGYACFVSPEEAIETVGNRLSELVHEKHLDSPERLIVWKCGSSCTGHSPESVAKWIADVKSVYQKILPPVRRADFAESRYNEKALPL